MAEGAIDVLMRIVASGSTAMAAESGTYVPSETDDPLLKDFVTGQCCELREFSFKAGIEKSLKKQKKKEAEGQKPAEPQATSASGAHRGGTSELDRKLALYKTRLDRLEKREKGDFVDMQPVEYTRVVDSASTLLFKALAECQTLDKISIVKRKAASSGTSGLGYLRLDFTSVLFTELEWKDSEHVMLESGTFIYRKVKIEYRPQKPDGTLIPGTSAEWTMTATRTGS